MIKNRNPPKNAYTCILIFWGVFLFSPFIFCTNKLFIYHINVEWVKVTQLYLTLCDPMDYTVHEIFQARILEWVAFPFSRGSSQSRNWTQVYPHCRRILYQLSHKGNPRVRGVDFESFVDTAAIKWVQHVIRGLNRIILDTCSPQIPSAKIYANSQVPW